MERSVTKANQIVTQQQTTSVNSGLISMAPKFFFGHKGDVRGNMFFLDNNIVCYPCGHNVVFYWMDDRSQKFIPGLEGSEGITAMALSHNRKMLAVCEQASKAICSVYNVEKMLATFKEKSKSSNVVIDQATIKKRRILVSTDYSARAFLSVDFDPNDKHLVTLGDDNRIVVWQYDKQKSVATEVIQLNSTTAVAKQISFSNLNASFILVTGKDVYKFYHLTDMNQLKCNHSGFNRKDDSQ